MATASNIVSFDTGYVPTPDEHILQSIFQQYERVLIESLITSFGLDFLVTDRHGGDVDTIHNVRQIGKDPEMVYKNSLNEKAYNEQDKYCYDLYHDRNPDYQILKRDTKKSFQASGKPIEDAYTGKNLYFYSKGAAKGNSDKQSSIDHVLTAHTIHSDRGRVLAGLRGEDLANAQENLVFTNAALNSSMGATKESSVLVNVERYINTHPELTDAERTSIIAIADKEGARGMVDVLALIDQKSDLSDKLKEKIGTENKLCIDTAAYIKKLKTSSEETDRADAAALEKLNADANTPINIFDIITSENISKKTKREIQNSLKEPVDIPRYIELHPELDGRTKTGLMQSYRISKASYEAKLRREYYTSNQFRKDMTYAAANVGVRMGLRQALGFVFAEMWFSTKDEIEKISNTSTELTEYLEAIATGLKIGCDNAKNKYPELWSHFLSGAVAGALSSVTTTLCNIFFTTAKNTVRIIRQCYASLVEAMKVLFINPENYEFGDRMRAVVKIISVGASVATGVVVSDAISHTPIGALGKTGDIVQNFCGAFVTGIMSCTLLMFLDKSELMNSLVRWLNNVHTIETELNYYRESAKYFERYAAQLMKIDLEQFERETAAYTCVADKLCEAHTTSELNQILKQAFIERGLPLPWEGFENFDTFMNNRTAHLVFE